MALLHLKFYAWVDVATGEFLDPDRNDAAWRDDPRLHGVSIGRHNTTSCQFANSPWNAVEDNVGCDAGDDTVGDTDRYKVNARKNEGENYSLTCMTKE